MSLLQRPAGWSPALALVLVALAAASVYGLGFGTPYHVDEDPNLALVTRLFDASQAWAQVLALDSTQADWIPSMLPGYHALLAGLLRLGGWPPVLDVVRALSLIASLGTVAAVMWAARPLLQGHAALRGLQFAALPMCFPLLPLVYTDVVALLFPALAAGFYFRGQPWRAGCLVTLALLFRQTNICWLLMLWAMVQVDATGYRLRLPDVQDAARRAMAFLPGLLLFIAFVAWNEGVAIGAYRDQQTVTRPHGGNVFFFMQLFFLLFLPWLPARWPLVAQRLRQARVWLLLVVLFLLYFFTYHGDHPWNILLPHLLRNKMLAVLFHSPATFLLGYVPVAVTALLWLDWPLLRASARLLLPFALLSLLPIHLIEPRYYLPACLFLLLFTRPQPLRQECTLLLWFALLSAAVVTGHLQRWFFL